jgi:hypothetical protein
MVRFILRLPLRANTNYSTRVQFSGDAKIYAGWKAGFLIVMDVKTGARSIYVNQISTNNVGGIGIGSAGPAFLGDTTDQIVRIRNANWWLESERLGRITVGRLTDTGPVDTIDLGGISMPASANPGCIGGAFYFRNTGNGTLSSLTLNRLTDHCGDYDERVNGITYTSPTVAGFVFGATIGGAFGAEEFSNTDGNVDIGRSWAVRLKYANEWNGFQFAAGVGYEVTTFDQDTFFAGVGEPQTFSDNRNVGFSVALKHVPTGLFIQGDYLHSGRRYDIPNTNALRRRLTWIIGISRPVLAKTGLGWVTPISMASTASRMAGDRMSQMLRASLRHTLL